jgi:hypothetical protein
MAGQEIRTLPFLEWRDPLATFELQDSPEFAAICHKENEWHAKLMKTPKIQEFIQSPTTKSYLSEHKKHSYIPGAFRAANGRYLFDVNTYSDNSLSLHLPGLGEHLQVENFDYIERANGDYVALTIDESDGQELYTLYVYFLNKKSTTLQWRLEGVGPDCAIVGGEVYFTRGHRYHIFDELVKCSLKDKTALTSIHKIKPTENQSLVKRNGHLYLQITDYAHSHLHYVNEEGISAVKPMTYRDQIVGGDNFIYFNSSTQKYVSTNSLHVLPDERPLFYSDVHGLVLTIKDGVQSLWRLSRAQPELALTTEVPGEIQIDRIACQESPHIFAAILRRVDEPPRLVTISKTRIVVNKPLMTIPEIKTTLIHAFSGPTRTKIKGLIAALSDSQPTNLLVYCYGAYGHPTRFWSAWNAYGPLLATGSWAICYVMARGGGDDSLEHIHAGRKYNRQNTIDDFEAVVKAAQIMLGIAPEHTALYGRSAGGIPVGMLISRYPRGELFKAAWMEAPFVDILRTMTDINIPLTLNETEEFGNPADGPAEFATMAAASPMDTLPSGGISGVYVLQRTGENDRQVYAYETLKYTQRLRGLKTVESALNNTAPGTVYTFCGKKEGHFYGSKTALTARIQDMATIDFWLSSK